MRGFMKRSMLVFAGFATVLGLSGGFVYAQDNSAGNGFRISPVRSEYTIEKGASQNLEMTVENPTGGTVTARGVVNNFIASEKEDGEPRLILDDNAPQPKNNFRNLVASIPELTLKPREKKDIVITIAVPADAEPGGYYGAIRFVPADGQGDGNVALTASVGSIVLVRVPGNLTEKLDLLDLGASQNGKLKGFMTGGNLAVAARLKNTGNIHVQPFGKIQIKDMFGKIIKEYEINATEPRANILPDSVRKFENDIEKPKRGWFGRYTIIANIGYSQGSGDLISTQVSFWYLPTWFLIGLFLLIVALVGGIFWWRSKGSSGHRRSIRRF